MKIRSTLVLTAIVTLPSLALAGAPVQTYTRTNDISRSEGLFTTRQFVPAADFRDGLLLNAEPYPANRADDPRRAEIGRLWVPRSPVGSRSITRELPYGFPGAAGVGAPFGANEEVIFVRSGTGLPNIAISPFDTIDDSTFDRINEQIPFIGSTRTRTDLRKDEILGELRAAQNQWLREQGYIQTVRTHVNPATLYGERAAGAVDASTIEPRAIIRKRVEGDMTAELQATTRGRTVTISNTGGASTSSVVRVSGSVETADADRE